MLGVALAVTFIVILVCITAWHVCRYLNFRDELRRDEQVARAANDRHRRAKMRCGLVGREL